MPKQTPATIFFAGTDTDVGKTYTASLFARSTHHSGVNVGVYKPVASGCRSENGELIADDALELWNSAGKPRSLDDVCPQKFVAPLSPPAAAALEQTEVDADRLLSGMDCWSNYELLIVEGAGGLMSPLAEGVLNIDLCKNIPDAKLIIVAANRLGVIHQTLATCSAATHHGITPSGIVLCCSQAHADESIQTNASEIATYTNIPILAEIGFGQSTATFGQDWYRQI